VLGQVVILTHKSAQDWLSRVKSWCAQTLLTLALETQATEQKQHQNERERRENNKLKKANSAD